MPRPNIILILLDDLGWVDLGCYGSSFYETPHIDRLAREGVRFTQAYAACPVCSPTRASILTGRYPATLQITNFIGGEEKGKLLCAPYLRQLPLEEKTIATALREAGYATWHVGKWHLGREPYYPERHGFDANSGGCEWGSPRNGYFSPWGNPKLSDGPVGEYLDDRLTDEAIKLIRARDKNRPFFLNWWPYLVHIPIQPKPELLEKHAARVKRLGLDTRDPFEVGEWFRCETKTPKRVIRRLFQSDPGYAAMVQAVDDNVGRMLTVLEEEGLAEDTVVIFTSDNGGLATAQKSPTTNRPLAEGKGWMVLEGGTREPLIVRWPGVTRAGTTCGVPVTSPDFYPTLLQMADLPLEPERHTDGVSMTPLLAGERTLARETLFWHYPHYGDQGGEPGCSVVEGDYKLIEFFEDNRVELYNLRDDIGDDRNLVAVHPDLATHLHAELSDWLRRVGARIPEPNPDWKPGRPG